MTKCNRSVCLAQGVFAHVDIVFGHDKLPARYCLACARTINRACRPMAGYALVPTTVEEVAEVLLAKLDAARRYEIEANLDKATPDDVVAAAIERDRTIAELGRRLLAPIPGAQLQAHPEAGLVVYREDVS